MTSATVTAEVRPSRLAHFPVSFFTTVMGLSGLTLATHKIEAGFGVSGAAQMLFFVSLGVFAVLAATYTCKAVLHPAAVLAEWRHPVRISFFPAASIGLILLGTAALPVHFGLAQTLWAIGAVVHLTLTLLVMTSWINHSRYEVIHTNPAWFIPVVGNILVPIAGTQFAPADVSWFFFAVGLVFWLVLLTILMYRLIFHTPLPGKLVPTMFILLAPPSVGFVSWVALVGGVDAFARLLYFAALFFFLLLLLQLPKFAQQRFALPWWAYSFPLAAFTIATLVMGERTGIAAYAWAGRGLFVLLAVVVPFLAVRTLLAVFRHEICHPEP